MGPVRHIDSMARYFETIKTPGLVVVDFSASWCGPCRMISPVFDSLAAQHPEALFAKVQEDDGVEGKAIVAEAGIRGFPTFFFFLDGVKKDEMSGANGAKLAEMVATYLALVPRSFEGSGFSLGGAGAAEEKMTAEAAREARLKRFGGGGGGGSSKSAAMEEDEAELAAALAMSVAEDAKGAASDAAMDMDATAQGGGAAEGASLEGAAASPAAAAEKGAGAEEGVGAPPPPMTLPAVDAALLAELVGGMGFPEVRARKALMAGSRHAEAAVNWLLEHGEDPTIDDPIPLVPPAGASGGGAAATAAAGGAAARSWRCVETGRLFRTMDELQMYAEKTGRSNFEESTEEKKPLSKEEVAARKAALMEKLAAKRAEGVQVEKVDEKQREKQRRTMGKETLATREVMEKEQRLREFELAKREKKAAAKERERLRAEIAKDKAERKARGGKLNSSLGVDGYNPAGMSATIAADLEKTDRNEQAADAAVAASTSASPPASSGSTPGGAAAKGGMPAVEAAIVGICKHKVGGDGAKALKLLGLYVKNVVEKPGEDKFRSINTESNAFKSKVAPIKGGVALLKAVGFVKNAEGTALELSVEERDLALLAQVQGKLDEALKAQT